VGELFRRTPNEKVAAGTWRENAKGKEDSGTFPEFECRGSAAVKEQEVGALRKSKKKRKKKKKKELRPVTILSLSGPSITKRGQRGTKAVREKAKNRRETIEKMWQTTLEARQSRKKKDLKKGASVHKLKTERGQGAGGWDGTQQEKYEKIGRSKRTETTEEENEKEPAVISTRIPKKAKPAGKVKQKGGGKKKSQLICPQRGNVEFPAAANLAG